MKFCGFLVFFSFFHTELQENLAYLKQLENDHAVPSGMKIVHPEAVFCLKSKNMETQEKVFINYCQHKYVLHVLLCQLYMVILRTTSWLSQRCGRCYWCKIP